MLHLDLPQESPLQATELTKRYGDRLALHKVSFRATPSSILGIFGYNGAGKTTLLRLCAGQEAPSAGKIRVHGLDPRREGVLLRTRLGYLGQKLPLSPDLTLIENLHLLADAQGVARAEHRRRFYELCERLMLERSAAAAVPVSRLASGVRRRASLAFALVNRPDVLLLDEPTSGVDDEEQMRLWEVVQETASAGATVVLSSHHPEEAEYCERVLLLHEGKVVRAGTVPELKALHVGGARVRIETSAERLYPLADRLAGQGYRVDKQHPHLHVYLDNYAEAPMRRLRTLVSGEEGEAEATIRLDLPSMEQVFREVVEAESK